MTSQIRRIERCSIEEIRAQWDRIAVERDIQLRSGRDVSFEFVLKPTILDLIQDADFSSVLDVGCGTGVLAELLASRAKQVTGVDMSGVSVSIAKASKSCPPNVRYFSNTVEDYLANTNDRFSLVVANMVLQDSADLSACLASIASRCRIHSVLVATITHPWFWPTYWGYDQESWFNYSEEQTIEAPFKISNDLAPIGTTTHFHRPLSFYTKRLADVGFQVEIVSEPMPQPEIQMQYPVVWKFPRFLAIRCRYQGECQ
ncbi:MAG: methyltransferase domain-containing protein [Sideroxydans sp.]|nr:methyltransferase domain-containing protein [Sideroxydans sp.]